jgi:hypothetical protein
MDHVFCLIPAPDPILCCCMDASATPSPAILQANRRLYELRARAQAERAEAALLNPGKEPAPGVTRATVGESRGCRFGHELPRPRSPMAGYASQLAGLPPHLGWESQPLTAVLRRAQNKAERATHNPAPTAAHPPVNTGSIEEARARPEPLALTEPPVTGWIKLYPDIGLGMLRRETAAAGRLWLLLRYLDRTGSGVVAVDKVTEQLTKRHSAVRLCGKRQLRNLLRGGEGMYWTRDRQHIWLKSAAKVAAAMDVARLAGRPVALPLTVLLGGIGAFRAHLYAAFHSARAREGRYGEQARPIARRTLAAVSGVGRSSQRNYEARAGVVVQGHFAVGEAATRENRENRAWQQGGALFELKDYRGRQGEKGKSYLAWQLPNSYVGQHASRPKGRQKRINRELKDLVKKGTPGNVGKASETRRPEQRYFANGRLAAEAYGRNPGQEIYWRRQQAGSGRLHLWQQLGGV